MHFTIVGASSSASFVCKPTEKYHTIMHYGGEETPLHYAQSHRDRQAGQRRRRARAAAKNHLCKQPSSITSCPRERDAACLPARLPGKLLHHRIEIKWPAVCWMTLNFTLTS